MPFNNKISRKLFNTMTFSNQPHTLLKQLLDLFKEIPSCQGYLLLILDEETNQFYPQYTYNLSKLDKEVIFNFIEEGIIDWSLNKKEPIIIPHPKNIGELGASTKNNFLIFPLIRNARKIGAIVAPCEPKKELKDEQAFKLLSEKFTVAIENIKLHTDMERRIKELSNLIKAAEIVNSSLEIDEILNSILKIISKEIRSKYSFLFIIEKKRLVPKISRGISLSEIQKNSFSTDQGVLGWVVQNRKPLIIDDYEKEAYFYHSKEFVNLAPRTLLIVPLEVENKVVSILTLCDTIDKPFYTKDNLEFVSALANSTSLAIKNSYLYKSLHQSFLDTITALIKLIDAKDKYTSGHSQRVTEYSLLIAEKLNLSKEEIEMIKFCGLIHDIGKIGINESILRKPSKLTEKEWAIIKTHPVIGEGVVKHINFLKKGLPIIRHHHEQYDGKGYPDGLKGEKIPLLARIVTIADAFDAMTSDRPYRRTFSPQEAIKKLKEDAGTKFDPQIVKIFIDALNTKLFKKENISPQH